MKKNSPVLKASMVLIVMAILGYIGLNVPQDYVEEIIDAQLDVANETSAESIDVLEIPRSVISVIDGDTFVVLVNGEKQTVRVLGIDTPETEYSPSGAECYGEEATNRANELLINSEVVLKNDSSQAKVDAYDRLLAYVTLSDGRDFGEMMIREGFAREYTYQKSMYKNQALYRAAEAEAREHSVGIWRCDG